MMTVFWYYRPYELDGVATQGVSFKKVKELLCEGGAIFPNGMSDTNTAI